mgnify:CR=1 FL=1
MFKTNQLIGFGSGVASAGACGSLSGDQGVTKTQNADQGDGGVTSATDETYGAAYLSFNGTTTAGWTAIIPGLPDDLIYDFGSGNGFVCKGYKLYVPSARTRMPITWTFQGANGGAYTTLDTVTSESWGVGGTSKTYSAIDDADFSNETSYYQYKWNITAVNGSAGATEIGEAEIFVCGD